MDEDFFNHQQRGATWEPPKTKGSDITLQLEVEFMEAVQGAQK